MRHKYSILPYFLLLMLLAAACTSVNCPMDNYVACKFVFYKSDGTKSSLNDELTVATLKPGHKTVYRHEKLGYTSITLDSIDHALCDTAGYSVRTLVLRNDTVLNKVTTPSEFTLPMSYYNECDTFVLSYKTISTVDTLYISHDNYTRVESPECGCYQYHNILNIRTTNNRFERMEVSRQLVDYLKDENIKIYLYDSEE